MTEKARTSTVFGIQYFGNRERAGLEQDTSFEDVVYAANKLSELGVVRQAVEVGVTGGAGFRGLLLFMDLEVRHKTTEVPEDISHFVVDASRIVRGEE